MNDPADAAVRPLRDGSDAEVIEQLHALVSQFEAPTQGEREAFLRLLFDADLKERVVAALCAARPVAVPAPALLQGPAAFDLPVAVPAGNEDAAISSSVSAADAFLLADQAQLQTEMRRYCTEIDRAVERLASDLTDPCEEAQAAGYPEASIWMTCPDTNTLETVAGAGETPRALHHLRRGIATDPALHDVIVDVVKNRRAERILNGRWDHRYDYYLWKEQRHKRFRDRFFIPLVIVRDRAGTPGSVACRWEQGHRDETSQIWTPSVAGDGLKLETVGALSLSSADFNPGDDGRVERVLELSTSIAARIYDVTLQGVIDRMLATLREASRAWSATIHFVPDGNALDYFTRDVEARGDAAHICYVARYNKRAEEEGFRKPGVIGGPPRSHGLGVDALADGRPKHLWGEALKQRNRGLWDDGVRGLSVYPLRTSADDSVGLVYLHQFHANEDLRIGPEIELLVDRVAHALSQAARELRQRRRAQERAAVNYLVDRFLVAPPARFSEMEPLLQAFAGALASFVGADLVLVRERSGVIASAGRFHLNPASIAEQQHHAHTVVYSQTTAGLARSFRLPLIVDGTKRGDVIVGYAVGNNCADEGLIAKLVDLGASALKLSGIARGQQQDRARKRALSEFWQKQRARGGAA